MNSRNLEQKALSPAIIEQLFQIPVFKSHIPEEFRRNRQLRAETTLDVNNYIVGSSGSTSFFFTVKTDEFVADGIVAGDRVLVDQDVKAEEGNIVVVEVDREYELERACDLLAANVWGVVTAVIRKLPTSKA